MKSADLSVMDSGDARAAQIAKALGHPLRITLFRSFIQGQTSPARLKRELGVPLTNVAYHTRELKKSGLIQLVKRVPAGGSAEHFYESAPGSSDLNCISAELDPAGWEEVAATLKATEEQISRIQAKGARRLARAKSRGVGATIVLATFGSSKVARGRKGRR